MKKINSTEMKVIFKNATITKDEDGAFIITEFSKDGEEENDLTVELENLLEIEGLNISITKKNEA